MHIVLFNRADKFSIGIQNENAAWLTQNNNEADYVAQDGRNEALLDIQLLNGS